MRTDIYSGQHTVSDREAVESYEDAVLCVAAHRAGAAESLDHALEREPHMVAAHALKGFGAILLGRAEMQAPASRCFHDAEAALASTGGSASEAVLVAALARALEGRMLSAASLLDRHLDTHPTDFLAIKLAHGLRFMSGDLAGMLAATSACVGQWSRTMPGYGFVLGCHAFGLEEAGHFVAAEKAGLEAIASETRDAWGIHAVSHVYEMQGRIKPGIALLTDTRPVWTSCNNFSFHMAWHLCLFQMENGRPDLAVDIYDRDVRPSQTDDFRDIANAVSLLWRLMQDGVDVGARWDELRTLAAKRSSDTTLIFASLHHMLTLLAVGDFSGAKTLLASIGISASGAACDQSLVARTVGFELAQALLNFAEHGEARANLSRLANDLPMLGGSNAQRDVFLRSLALAAAECQLTGEADKIMKLRQTLKHEDRFAARIKRVVSGARGSAALQLAS